MSSEFYRIAFTDAVKRAQVEMGSRDLYARLDGAPRDNALSLGSREREFIAARDSFYMATVGETGWPYIQHRGGPPGFVRVLDDATLGFADFAGNRQYVSVGNLSGDGRVALFFMDYPNRKRLKLLGHAQIISSDRAALPAGLPGDRSRVERVFLIRVAAFDWNCPRHITPRFSDTEMAARTDVLQDRIVEL